MPIENNLRLDELQNNLKNTHPLMQKWAEARVDIFDEYMENERNPYQGNLRSLSYLYLRWKRKNYPGRKKRELTGETWESHKVTPFIDRIEETVKGKGGLLQNYLDLPILPMDGWDQLTETRFVELTFEYLDG